MLKQYADSIGQNQFMKLVEKAATGDKTIIEQFRQFTNKE